MTSTIFALSSGRPPAGIAVVRVSGPAAFAALAALTATPLPPPRSMTVATLRDPADNVVIDRCLVVRFVAPASATGEDLVELHLHGGVAVVAAAIRVLGDMADLTMAGPGAFTRRAFDNGRIRLPEAEALADLLAAETEAARRQAIGSGDRLSAVVDRWRATLIGLLAEVEATLDFADAEDDVAAGVTGGLVALAPLRDEISVAVADGARGEQLRDGLTVVITGPPNAGKSSLINALARRDVAIVAEAAGTTRDVIEVRLDLGGVSVTLVDTAGVRAARDAIEAEGIRRGVVRAAAADLVLRMGRAEDDNVSVVGKIDLSGDSPGRRNGKWFVSAQSGAGMGELVEGLTYWASEVTRPGEPALVGRERQRIALADGLRELHAVNGEGDLVLVAERLRRAVRALGVVTGVVAVDDVLDSIFGQFCIGK